jgi:GT2 family glycosyltransferase
MHLNKTSSQSRFDRLSSPFVAVVVLNWNGKRNTFECLSSLLKLNYNNFKIFVIDNASTDGSQEFIKTNFPDVHLIENSENLGFGEGLNVGIREALILDATYVLCLNNDVVLDKLFLKEIVHVGESIKNVGGLCPLEYSYNQPDKIICAGGQIGFIKGKLRGFGESDKGQFNKIEPTGLLSGPAMMFKLDSLKSIGLFDKSYFYGPEDQDIALRLLKNGYSIIFAPGAKVWHKRRGATNNKITPLNDYFHSRNFLLFVRKNGTKKDLFFSLLYFGLIDFPMTFTKRLLAGKWRHAKALLIGVIWHLNSNLTASDPEMVESLLKH